MELLDLRYFVSIAETGSFTKAALKNNIAQSALSRRIRELESDLGVTLFYRNGRGVVPTDAGETLLARGRVVLADVESLRQELGQQRGVLGGTVTLGVPPSVGLALLAPLLARIRAEHPGIRMRVLEGFSGHVAEWMVNGRVDLAVLYKTRTSTLLDAEHLLFEDMYLISAAHAPAGAAETVPLSALADLELVLPGQPHGLRLLVDEAAAQTGVPLNVAMELETLPTICDLVATGTIRTVLPLTAVQARLKDGALVAQKIVGPVISRELILAHAPQRAAAPATRAVVRHIRAQIEALVRAGDWVGRI